MNYSKIYSAFIADRRNKEQSLIESGAYCERHHINPRSIGGGDDKCNLITLTPEDHFFAHLLLAKIHGGKLWAVIAFMVGGSRKDYKPTVSRIAHGWAARALAKSITGDLAYQFDRVIYSIEHHDGRKWSGMQSEIPIGTGLSKSMANMLIKGRIRTAKGWFLKGSPPPERFGSHHPMHSKEIYHLIHINGREFVGTQYDFNAQYCIGKASANRLVRGNCFMAGGWSLKGVDVPKQSISKFLEKQPKAPKGKQFRFSVGCLENTSTDHTIYGFVVIATGEIIRCKKYEIRHRFDISSGQLSTLFSGRQKKTHGICLADKVWPKTEAAQMAGATF